MNNEIVKIEPVTDAQRQAWSMLPETKNKLAYDLQCMELNAQGILQKVDNPDINDYNVIEAGLQDYRNLFNTMKETRLAFTNIITSKIVQPLMEYEKRVDYAKNAKYNDLFNKVVDLKKKAAADADTINNRNKEAAQFAAHVQNEYQRTAGMYQAFLRQEINALYQSNLANKVSWQSVQPALTQLKGHLANWQKPPMAKFIPRFISLEQMNQIWREQRLPDWDRYLNDALSYMDQLFVNYESDLANAEAAIKHNEEQAKKASLEAEQQAKESEAMTNLVTSAEVVMVEQPKLKKTLKIVTPEDPKWNDQFATNVMAAFIVNRNNLIKYLRVSSWANLKISQMVDALGKLATETGEVFNNLELEEDIK